MYIFHAIHRRTGCMTLHVCMGLIEKCPDMPRSDPLYMYVYMYVCARVVCVSLIQLSFSGASVAAHFNAQQCVWLLFIRARTRTRTLTYVSVYTCCIDRGHNRHRRHATSIIIACKFPDTASRFFLHFSSCRAQQFTWQRSRKSNAACLDLHINF